jgi:hypothetical protein
MEDEIKKFILEKWNSNNKDRFPGPQPVSIERCHFNFLKTNDYFVCEKTDGVRHFLVCFMDSQGRKICALVNRVFQYALYPLTIPRDTLLDGEVIGDQFIIHDAVCIQGEDLRKMNLDIRLSRALALTKIIVPGSVKIRVKQMVALRDIQKIHLEKGTDGVIFTPINEPIRMGTHRTLFKWKPKEKCTIDFLLRDGKLCIQNESRYEPVQEYHGGGEGTIYECMFDGTRWTPIITRIDKKHPNNKRTFERTLVNIQENITFCELVHAFSSEKVQTHGYP